MKLTLEEIARVVGAKNNLTELSKENIHQIEFDSRLIQQGDIFLPLKGARDGHEFIETAFQKGAIATFSEHEIPQAHFLVEDNLKAFQKLAAYYLEKMKVPVIAVTGSNGKTTTKDMIAAVLAQKFRTYKTQGNHNNEIGLPYTILHMPEDTEKLVLEMGMDHFGDIHFLSKLAQPSLALITLIGEAHLEFMGSRERIAEGKMGIIAGLHGELIAPADPIINPYIPENQKITRFGADEDIYITQLVEHKDYLTFNTNFLEKTLTIPAPGKFNATNAMLAAYVGTKFNISEKEIKEALAHVELTRNRTEWKKASNGADILSDVYNANPTAMKLILETFQSIPKNKKGRKLAILADMLELGETSPELHADIATVINFEKLDRLYLYGPLMENLYKKVSDNPAVAYFDKLESLTESIKSDLEPNDQLLVKGSNGMKLSSIIETLEKE
ncbi:UDP-N-acetylmuramoyl-tripeptide--D-alanyl-D-alanine ligase [Lactococcus nasutitermitis]|uniref:UDP-N-acetylmuramoyl-tripeptide--D-alanyl-D-alanine ligase n=1 Tax=Lactococcus nasutitermitis TaxID=1652957 RepID=A0ABV9JFW0_9LACT|nr:UDP-N-acetylmuramoyl-tripeptide--D-alanyl-D-alanine ligase [Lactococcus nasutitermitis]